MNQTNVPHDIIILISPLDTIIMSQCEAQFALHGEGRWAKHPISVERRTQFLLSEVHNFRCAKCTISVERRTLGEAHNFRCAKRTIFVGRRQKRKAVLGHRNLGILLVTVTSASSDHSWVRMPRTWREALHAHAHS